MLFQIATAVLAGAYLLSFAGRWHFMLDNLTSFQVHFAIGFLVLLAGNALASQPGWASLCGAGLIVALAQIAPWYFPVDDVEASSSDVVSVLSANVSPRNRDATQLLARIRQEDPEIIGLVELTPRFAEGLSEIHDRYPYRFEKPVDGFYGMAVYSKFPLSGTSRLDLGIDYPSAISTVMDIGDSEIRLVLVHPYAPMTSRFASTRNSQLATLARHVVQSNRPVFLFGDMNIAMWSPYYRDFVRSTGLKNARAGRGIAGTYPPSRILGVPIDHIMAAQPLEVRGFRVLSGIGSDHLPVVAQLTVPRL